MYRVFQNGCWFYGFSISDISDGKLWADILAFYCGENVAPAYSSRSIHTRLALSVLKISNENLPGGRMCHTTSDHVWFTSARNDELIIIEVMSWFLILSDCFGRSNISDIPWLCPAWLSSYLGHAERYGTKWTKERDKRAQKYKKTQ